MPEERIDHTNDTVERHPSLLLSPNVADSPAQAIGVIIAACGRFTCKLTLPELVRLYRLTPARAPEHLAALQHLPDHEYCSRTGRRRRKDLVSGGSRAIADSVAVRPESHQIGITSEASPNKQEIERRRETVRQFFDDFWMSTDDKPRTFAERLNRAEDHINERLAACGEAWRLDAATRKQLSLPN